MYSKGKRAFGQLALYYTYYQVNFFHMYTLYVKTGCPYCTKVISFVKEKGITIEEKNISDEKVLEDLIARGGKKQVPYLVDSSTGKEMYESDEIISYLKTV
jgi:glutaredoxin